MTYRVGLTLLDGFSNATLFTDLLVLPNMSEDRITIGYVPAAGGELTPELLLNGSVAATGTAIPSTEPVTLEIDHYDAGSSGINENFFYSRTAGEYLAVGLDAGQISTTMLNQIQTVVNNSVTAQEDGQSFSADDQTGGMLSLAILKYFYEVDQGQQLIEGLKGATEAIVQVASGIATSDGTTTYHYDIDNPAVPGSENVDVGNLFHALSVPINKTLNPSDADAIARTRLIDDNGSAQESAIWEELNNTPSISTIKSLQLANQAGIPVFTINQSNENTYLPQLTVGSQVVSQISNDIANGATVTIPRDQTPLNEWQGVGYIDDFSAVGGSIAYIIFGGLTTGSSDSGATFAPMSGGSGTGPPNSGNNTPNGNNPNATNTGDPMNIANGNFSRDETDISIPNIGFPLQFSRYYNSQSSLDVGMGPGWSFSFSDHLTFSAGSVTWITSQGESLTFTPNGSGGFNNPNTMFGVFSTITAGFQWRNKDGTTYVFTAGGLLSSIGDRNGNGLVMTYNGANQLVAVSDKITKTTVAKAETQRTSWTVQPRRSRRS